MSDAICFSAKKNCYAVIWSYGEICVGSNCCGQSGKGLKMWQARLAYHKSCLEDNLHFDRFEQGWEEIQRKNIKENIRYERAKIKLCKQMIRYYQKKQQQEEKK